MTRDLRLDVLRAINIFAIVLLHVVSVFQEKNHFDIHNLTSWLINFLNYSLFWGVPVFLMLSGALLLNKSHETMYEFYQKRINKVLIPTLFWSILYLTYLVIYQDFTLHNILGAIFKGIYHLWFMYAIIGIYIFTPYLRILLRNLNDQQINWLIILIFIFTIGNFYLGSFLKNNDTIFSIFISYLGYFILGRELYKRKNMFTKYKHLYGPLFLITVFFVSIIAVIVNNIYLLSIPINGRLTPFVALESILLFLYLTTKEIHFQRPTLWINLSSLSFGVYLIHPLFILILTPYLIIENQIYLVFLFFLVILASYVSVYLLKNIKFLKNLV